MGMSKAIVVGGGVSGASVAYNLVKRGVEVTLVEKSYPGSGATGRGAGGIISQHRDTEDIILARESRSILEGLSAELGFNILFRQCGFMKVATDESSLRSIEKDAHLQASLGLETRTLEPSDVKSMVPYMDVSTVMGATHTLKDGVCHPFTLLYGYLYGFRRLGGKIIKYTEAKEVEAEGEKKKVVTDAGTLEADHIVVAAGAYTREIVRSLGITIPSQVFKREILATESLKPFLKPMVLCLPSTLYFNQTIRGELIGGIDGPRAEEGYLVKSSLGFMKRFSKELLRMMPAMKVAKILRPWAGTGEVTPDGKPVIGKTGFEGLYVVCGDGGRGFTLAPVVGELLAELITEGKSRIDLSPFSLQRFERIRKEEEYQSAMWHTPTPSSVVGACVECAYYAEDSCIPCSICNASKFTRCEHCLQYPQQMA